jgi:hypothetical protein
MAQKVALQDSLQNVSRVYICALPAADSQAPFDYNNLPRVALNEIQVGQIVAWRTLVLSPSFTAELAPWQERQLVSITSDGLTFRSHNANRYLNAWWLDDDDEKVCTVKEWLETRSEEHPLDVTVSVDFAFEDLRLLHAADVG